MTFQQHSVADFIKQHGLPPETTFKGYVVHLPHSDEFLANYNKNNKIVDLYAWAKTPVLAHIFTSHLDAVGFCNEYGKGAVMCLLFDTVDNYVVV